MNRKNKYLGFVFIVLFIGTMSAVGDGEAQEKTEETVQHDAVQLVNQMMDEDSLNATEIGEGVQIDNQAVPEVSLNITGITEPYQMPPMAEIIKAMQQPKESQKGSLPQQEEGKPRRISLEIGGMDIVDVLKLLSREG